MAEKKKLVIGILAHVDAGKTTLSEALLYTSGSIRKMGRVDNRDAFLDTYALEKERGITIFSKQAMFCWKNTVFTLLDTPGHADFSAEMERTLRVLDYAILVVSGADGVQGHTATLWKLLKRYRVPVFLFVNKMDQAGTDRLERMEELKKRLDSNCIDFEQESGALFDEIAMSEENVMEYFLQNDRVEPEQIRHLIAERRIFPCYFGSALKLNGIEQLLDGLDAYMLPAEYTEEFGAKVFKIARDEQGGRLTYLKITGGSLKVKDAIMGEKVNQIRRYLGGRFETLPEAYAGDVCAVTGLSGTYAGEGLGVQKDAKQPFLEPVLTYQILLPDGTDAAVMLPKLRQMEEEEPQLRIVYEEETKEIQAQVMGKIQLEILQRLILERFGISVSFGVGKIVYKETIRGKAEGVGHFEPLRHYAEVHLLLEEGAAGSGMQYELDCSEDMLDKNWQRLIYTHLTEREQRGVLTGSVLTDTKITLKSGKAHTKHTEGGDFRQAVYRAVRQGLMQAESVLLEPYYEFRIEVPAESVGRVMSDIEKRFGTCRLEEHNGELSVLMGTAPVAAMQDYAGEINAFTRGRGRISYALKGYDVCHNQEEVIAAAGYEPERDLAYTPDSVFCAHGAGFIVPWQKVPQYMHLESCLGRTEKEAEPAVRRRDKQTRGGTEEIWIGTEEIDAILEKTYGANRRKKDVPRNGYRKDSTRITTAATAYDYRKKEKNEPEYLLIDGYNVIFAWDELKALAAVNLDGARGKLLDLMCNYQGIRQCELIVVFDAYRIEGHETETFDYHNIHVVYTREAETADQYIEKFAHTYAPKAKVTVATSDGLEQVIIRGAGCMLLSARDLQAELERVNKKALEEFEKDRQSTKQYLLDGLSEEEWNNIKKSQK